MEEKLRRLRWDSGGGIRTGSRFRQGPKCISSTIVFTIFFILVTLTKAQENITTTALPLDSTTDQPRYDLFSLDPRIAAPENVTVTLAGDEGTATVTWDHVDPSSIEGYQIKIECQRDFACCGSCDSSHTVDGNSIEITLDGETSYKIQVAATKGGRIGNYSDAKSLETKAFEPRSPAIEEQSTNTSVILTWNYPCPYTGPVIYLASINGNQRNVSKDSCQYHVTAENLDPFTNYSYSVMAVNPDCVAECEGILYSGEQTTVSESAETEEVFETTIMSTNETEDTSITFENSTTKIGEKTSTPFPTSYSETTSSTSTTSFSDTATSNSTTASNSEVITTVTESPLPCYSCKSGNVKTLPGVAEKATINCDNIKWAKFRTSDDTSTRFWWSEPQVERGKVEDFKISVTDGNTIEYCDTYKHKDNYDECSICLSCGMELKNGVIKNTKINTNYKIEVRAINENTTEYGPPGMCELTTESGWPHILPGFYSHLTGPEREEYPLYEVYPFRFNKEKFDERHGNITNFMILLSKKDCQGKERDGTFIKPADMEPSKTFQGRVVYEDYFLPDEIFKFENLDSSTRYFFKVRAYSDEKFADSSCVGFETQFNAPRDRLISILSSVAIILFVMIIAGLILKYLSDRSSPYIKSGDSMESPLLLPPVVDASFSRPIPLSRISDEVQRLMAEGQTELKNEYQDLNVSSPSKPNAAANAHQNLGKNRYRNILPFDETRVILNEYRGIPESDYINASYIHGYETPKEFIACQGPREHELGDFWRMIWEKNVHVIVMVTKCVEARTEKCGKYWPDYLGNDLDLRLPELKITTLEDTPHTEEGYVYRIIKLTKNQFMLPFPKSRIIKQFHYVLWPDMGCPKNPDDLIHFTNVVKQAIPRNTRTVVHCSAGVGRTGTFIALYNLQEEMKTKKTVDVFQAVYRMRQNRQNMVQNLAQYGFIYRCVQRCEDIRQGRDKPEQERIYDIPDVITTTFSALDASDVQDDPYQSESKPTNTNSPSSTSQETAVLIELESMSEEEFENENFTTIPLYDKTNDKDEAISKGDVEIYKEATTTPQVDCQIPKEN